MTIDASIFGATSRLSCGVVLQQDCTCFFAGYKRRMNCPHSTNTAAGWLRRHASYYICCGLRRIQRRRNKQRSIDGWPGWWYFGRGTRAIT